MFRDRFRARSSGIHRFLCKEKDRHSRTMITVSTTFSNLRVIYLTKLSYPRTKATARRICSRAKRFNSYSVECAFLFRASAKTKQKNRRAFTHAYASVCRVSNYRFAFDLWRSRSNYFPQRFNRRNFRCLQLQDSQMTRMAIRAMTSDHVNSNFIALRWFCFFYRALCLVIG